jgi:hypothetical protein
VEASPTDSVLDAPTELNLVALSPTSIELSWTNNAPTADEIVIERSTDGGANWTLLERIDASLSAYEDSPVVCETAYSYRVAVYRVSGDQLSDYSAVASITPPCPPDVPVLLEPADGAPLNLSQPLLTWQGTQDAARYEVELSAPGLAVGTHSVTDTRYTPATPLLTTTYQWRVRAFNASDAPSEWSAPRSFTILSSSRAVPVIHFYTVNTITLTWNRVTWAAGYEVQIASESRFRTLVTGDDELGSDVLNYTATLPNGQYYWRARARRADGSWGSWSDVATFVVHVP